MKTNKRLGFSMIEVLIVVLVVVIFGFLGYTYYNNVQNSNSSVVDQNPVANDVVEAPVIKTTDDLTKAEKVLDDTNLDNTDDNSQLDSELSKF